MMRINKELLRSDSLAGLWPGESGPKLRKRCSSIVNHYPHLWHTATYSAVTPLNSVNADTPAVTDSGVLFIINNHFLFQVPMALVAAYASGATLTRARLDSGNIRYYGNPYIRPFNPSVLPGSNPGIMVLWDRPFILPAREEIAAQLSNGAAEREYLALWLMPTAGAEPGYQAADPGPFWAVRWTGTTAVVANAWSIEPYTLETALPSGTYNMIDLDAQSTNGVLARMFFDTQFFRPGVLMFNALGNRDLDIWRPGILGKMNKVPFVNDRLPAIEINANAADAAFEGYFYLQPASPPAIQQSGMGMGASSALSYRVGA